MTIDLAPDPAVAELAARTAAFVDAVVAPEEQRLSGVATGGSSLGCVMRDASCVRGYCVLRVA